MQDQYKVSYKYDRDIERFFEDSFSDLEKAKTFIKDKLLYDAAIKVKVVYRLFKNDVLIEIFDPETIDFVALKGSSQDSSGKGQSAGFRPTPFNTAPRPSGTPKKWIKDEDEDKDKDKK